MFVVVIFENCVVIFENSSPNPRLPRFHPMICSRSLLLLHLKKHFLISLRIIWLCQVLVLTCGILFPDQELNLSPLHLGTWSLSHWTTREVPLRHFTFRSVICFQGFLVRCIKSCVYICFVCVCVFVNIHYFHPYLFKRFCLNCLSFLVQVHCGSIGKQLIFFQSWELQLSIIGETFSCFTEIIVLEL